VVPLQEKLIPQKHFCELVTLLSKCKLPSEKWWDSLVTGPWLRHFRLPSRCK
jgi:hypothetical protein